MEGIASGARERTETAGGSAGLGRFCARQAWRISGSAEEKRSPAAGAGAGGSGESEVVWSPAQRVSTRRPHADTPLPALPPPLRRTPPAREWRETVAAGGWLAPILCPQPEGASLHTLPLTNGLMPLLRNSCRMLQHGNGSRELA